MKLSAVFRVIVIAAGSWVTSAAIAGTFFGGFFNSAPILVPSAGNTGAIAGAPASPYPSTVVVSGLDGVVDSVGVTIFDFRHHFPDDVDIMLVSPTGEKMIIMSDAGGNNAVGCADSPCTMTSTGKTLTFRDGEPNVLPDSTALSNGSYVPTNFGTGDQFPAPAPSGFGNPAPAGSATFANTFRGINPNGTWSLYVVDDESGDVGMIQGGWSLSLITFTPVAAGELIISEYRPRGPNGISDEFVELYNATNHDISVGAADGTNGFALVASDGVKRVDLPNGTKIPARGHYLIINPNGYSINTTGLDSTFTTEIPNNRGIALFNSSTVFSQANRLDAVGPTTEANALYREGTGHAELGAGDVECSFFRRYDLVSGFPVDTNNNASDFVFVSTDGNPHGPPQLLGAPGPQSAVYPVFLGNTLGVSAVDPGCPGLGPSFSACGEARDTASDPANHAFHGTLSIRRKITNNSGAPITSLTFRAINISTVYVPGKADLRILSSPSFTASLSGGGSTTIQGLNLEPPAQSAGGSVNSSLSAVTITTGSPLLPGASINVHFLMGVEFDDGPFDFEVMAETLPAGGALFSLSEFTVANLANISTRLQVETGDNALIGGFIVTGTQDKKVILRAIGPSLPFPGVLANPTLELYHGDTLLASNDNWIDSPNKQAIIDSTIPPSNDLESAIVATLPANNSQYTAVVRGANDTTGFGVVEAYDLDRSVDSRLANISTRGLVQTGDNVLIAGTIALGLASQHVIVRAIGPSLSVPGKIADPALELRNGNGGLLDSNDNWVDSPNKQAIIDSTIPPTNDLESAIVTTLPGDGAQYTAIVRGAGGSTGVAVVEIYALK